MGDARLVIGIKHLLAYIVNTKKVTSMSNLFSNCLSLDKIDITNFNTSNIFSLPTTMYFQATEYNNT